MIDNSEVSEPEKMADLLNTHFINVRAVVPILSSAELWCWVKKRIPCSYYDLY